MTIQMKFDEFGLITQLDGNSGDASQREGFYSFGKWVVGTPIHRDEMYRVLNLLQASPGIFRRHPVQFNDPNDESRDQMNPLIIAMGAYEIKNILRITLWNHIKRFGRYQNKDWAGPVDWGIYVRAFRAWYLYPYLLFSDLFLILGSLINIVKSFDRGYTDDSMNHTMTLIQARHFLSTPFSWLARVLYFHYRRPSLGTIELGYKNTVVGALYWYNDPRFGGNKDLADLWETIILQG